MPRWNVILKTAGLLTFFASWFLGNGGWILLIAACIWIVVTEYAWQFFKNRFVSPYLWMLLSPLLLWHYSSVNDFRIRLACFFMLIYILILAQNRGKSRMMFCLDGVKPWRIWLLSFLVFALAAIALYAKGIHLSGDEPHYIMIAQSLVEDKDFDLKNNLDPAKYSPYMPVEIKFHGSVQAGRYHSFHFPGVSFLLIPFYFLFNLLHGAVPGNLYFRLAAALINSFFALGLFLAMQKVPVKKKNNNIFFLFLFTFPLLFQALHLFPELPAATLVIFAYIFARCHQLKSSANLGCSHNDFNQSNNSLKSSSETIFVGGGSDLSVRNGQRYFLAGLFLAGLPWLHLKYAVPALILSLFILAWIWLGERRNIVRLKHLAAFSAAPALSLALLGLYSRMLYGSFSPFAVMAQFSEKNMASVPLGLKIETLLSFFLDQRDGLLVYAPVFLLLLLVFKKEIKSEIRDFSLLTAIFLSYIMFHANTTSRGGYAPAARPTLFVMWIMVIFITAYYRQAGEAGKTLFRFLAGLTSFATVWFFYYPHFLYQPVTREVVQRASGMLLFLSSEVIRLPDFFPSFLKKPNSNYLPNWIWLAVLAILILLFYARIPSRTMVKPARIFSPALGMLLMFAICFFPHVNLQTRYTASGLSFYCNSRNFSFNKEMSSYKILAGQDYDLFFDLKGSAANHLNLHFLNSENGMLEIKNGRKTLLAENQAPESRLALRLQELHTFTLGKKTLVHLGIESTTSKRNTFFVLKIE